LTRSAVLIVTNERDVGADFLVHEFDRRGVPVVRLNSERGPEWQLTLDPLGEWHIAHGARGLRASECAGVWWRRPEVPPLDMGDSSETLADQWRVFLGALATTPGPTWVSDPGQIRLAENKALQLRAARAAGLNVPRTIWTNDVDAARGFVDSCGGMAAVKSVTTAWWEEPDGANFVYASLISIRELPQATRLALAPVVFQQPITPKRDIRVTVVEDIVMAAIQALPDDDDAARPIDWRLAEQHPWAAYELPEPVSDACCELVSSLSLRFGAIDFALDQDGQLWFLELNPNGEWGWLQRVGLPIAEALADTLTQISSTGR
jgi:glutathione synthase/RimK-type ligase-like ATP-grasp enzyme